jgi:predicted phage tail protein
MTFKRNTLIIYDLISEGEIELVNGLSSIYLNKTPIVNSDKQHIVANRTFSATTTASSADIVLDDGGLYTLNNIRPIRIQKGYKAAGSATASAGSTTVNTAGAFFDVAMIASETLGDGGLFQKVRIAGAGPAGSDYVGEIVERASSTSATVSPAITTAVSGAAITFDFFAYGKITASGVTLLNSAVAPISGTFYTDIGAAGIELGQPDASALNYKFVKVNFRTGTMHQDPVVNIGGFSNASFGKTVGTELKQYTDFYGQKLIFGKDKTAVEYATSGGEITVVSDANLPVTCDRILLTINTSSLSSVKRTNQEKGDAGITILVFFDYKSGSGAWATQQVFGPTAAQLASSYAWVWNGKQSPLGFYSSGDIYGRDQESSDHEFSFNIDQYKPFDQFRIRIRRVTPVNYKMGSYDYSNGTTVKSVQGFIEDRLSYPHSAYAAVMFDSQEFEGTIPERMYHCYGIRCEVPTNYMTRRESNDGVANYKRHVTNGTQESTYQPWDGLFRTAYCDNPVWVLRTLLLENRFGLGNWLSADQINRYSFYSLARRCDELVPDGEGGLEPRFTCGVYLTQATEAYKIIKDFCSIMFSIPYWMDGQLVLEADRPGEPMYTFTKSNIIGGTFSYEGTGNKTRPNQIAVTFNDRKNLYTQTIELVDDVEDMIHKNRVYSEDVVAFGATSRGQAIRYAKWKLLTSKLNREILVFKTGENAGFLRPGSIIRVQDADRYRIRNSGRIISSTTSSIVLDKAVNLGAGTYTLHVLVPGSAAYLAQPAATISTVPYVEGDIIAGVDTEVEAATLVDDSGNEVKVFWVPDSHLENRVVTTSSGSGINTLTVSPSFSAAPEVDFIWALSNTLNNATVEGSSKLYRVLGIAEESPGTYAISATEHYNQKFDELDELYLSEDTGTIDFNEIVPVITNFTASLSPKISGASTQDSVSSVIGLDIVLRWTPPMNDAVNSTTSLYNNLKEYRLNIIGPSGKSTVKLPKTATQYILENVNEGNYEFDIQAVGLTGAASTPVYATILAAIITTGVPGTINQLGVPRGGHFSTSPTLNGKKIVAPDDYVFNGASGAKKTVSGGI